MFSDLLMFFFLVRMNVQKCFHQFLPTTKIQCNTVSFSRSFSSIVVFMMIMVYSMIVRVAIQELEI